MKYSAKLTALHKKKYKIYFKWSNITSKWQMEMCMFFGDLKRVKRRTNRALITEWKHCHKSPSKIIFIPSLELSHDSFTSIFSSSLYSCFRILVISPSGACSSRTISFHSGINQDAWMLLYFYFCNIFLMETRKFWRDWGWIIVRIAFPYVKLLCSFYRNLKEILLRTTASFVYD